MRRLDWHLVRPGTEGEQERAGSLAIAIERAWERAIRSPPGSAEAAELAAMEEEFERVTVSQCKAVAAPRVDDDPDWESRIIDEYGESEADMELEDYLDVRRKEPDCERCPYASPYSLFPMDPCEFSAGVLLDVLHDQTLAARVERAMDSDGMRELARALQEALDAQAFDESVVVDTRDYLDKAIQFLRFWAEQGFGIAPRDLDEALVTQAAAEASDPENPPTLH